MRLACALLALCQAASAQAEGTCGLHDAGARALLLVPASDSLHSLGQLTLLTAPINPASKATPCVVTQVCSPGSSMGPRSMGGCWRAALHIAAATGPAHMPPRHPQLLLVRSAPCSHVVPTQCVPCCPRLRGRPTFAGAGGGVAAVAVGGEQAVNRAKKCKRGRQKQKSRK